MSFMDEAIVADTGTARERRQRRLIHGQMTSDRLPAQDIVIRNISTRGLGASSQGLPPKMGERITVQLLAGSTITGVVRWLNGSFFGLALDKELDFEELCNVLKRPKGSDSSGGWEVMRLHRVVQPLADRSTFRSI